jgi:hypothetical protein
MVLLNIEKDDDKLSKTQTFVDKTYTEHHSCINGGFTGEPPEVFNKQLHLSFIPFYTIINVDGTIAYNGGRREDLFEIAEKVAKKAK